MIRITTHLGDVEIGGAGEDELNEMFAIDDLKVKEISWHSNGLNITVRFEDGSTVDWDVERNEKYTDAALLVLDYLGF